MTTFLVATAFSICWRKM